MRLPVAIAILLTVCATLFAGTTTAAARATADLRATMTLGSGTPVAFVPSNSGNATLSWRFAAGVPVSYRVRNVILTDEIAPQPTVVYEQPWQSYGAETAAASARSIQVANARIPTGLIKWCIEAQETGSAEAPTRTCYSVRKSALTMPVSNIAGLEGTMTSSWSFLPVVGTATARLFVAPASVAAPTVANSLHRTYPRGIVAPTSGTASHGSYSVAGRGVPAGAYKLCMQWSLPRQSSITCKRFTRATVHRPRVLQLDRTGTRWVMRSELRSSRRGNVNVTVDIKRNGRAFLHATRTVSSAGETGLPVAVELVDTARLTAAQLRASTFTATIVATGGGLTATHTRSIKAT
ncbi:MAG: hypothetical protein JWM86_1967 [Thermoleophilia bacterium]|nr:hypothetical protein [Thermoleophilia bacterium]